jgi:hypothetical protein
MRGGGALQVMNMFTFSAIPGSNVYLALNYNKILTHEMIFCKKIYNYKVPKRQEDKRIVMTK